MEKEENVIRDGLQLYGSKRDGEVQWWEEEEDEEGGRNGRGGVWVSNERNGYMVFIEERGIEGELEEEEELEGNEERKEKRMGGKIKARDILSFIPQWDGKKTKMEGETYRNLAKK